MNKNNGKDKVDENDDIDYILEDIGGTFGRFQVYNYILFFFAMGVAGIFVLDFVFTTLDIDYRCKISECDTGENLAYNPDWLSNAIPLKNGRPDKCHRFANIDSQGLDDRRCEAKSFNRSKIISCANDGLIYRTDEISIVNQFNITCAEGKGVLAMVGTMNNVGRLVFLPIIGHLSDRFGRKSVLVSFTLACTIFKFLKSFATSYNMFLILEILDAGFGAVTYPTALILGMEWATTKRRVLVTCIIISSYPFGQVIIALVAAYTHNFQWLLRLISIPGFFIIFYIWITPESLRWLLVNRKYERALAVVHRATKINRITVSQKTLDIIALKCKSDSTPNCALDEDSKKDSINSVLRSCSLLTRLAICLFCWIAATFVTYGVSIVSVSMQGDKYINFMVVSFGAVPAVFLTLFMLTYMGRRWTICLSLFVTGASILASKFFAANATLALILFFIGKCFIHHSFTVLYVYTSEMWPTSLRHSTMGVCSMVGRLGSIAAPLAPLLANYMEYLPFIVLSGFAFSSGLLTLCLPETFRRRLPDSLDDVKNAKETKSNLPQVKH